LLDLDISQRVNPLYMDRAIPTIRPYVYQVLVHADPNCLEPEGSCVFINYKRRFFMVTAGHVWASSQSANPAGIYVFNIVGPDAEGPETSFIEIPGEPLLSENYGDRTDNVDLAVIEIDENFFRLSGFSAVPERMFAEERDKGNWNLILQGFPAARTKKYLKARGKIHKTFCMYYLEEKVLGFDWKKYPLYNAQHNIPVPYGVGRDMAYSPTYPKRANKVSPNPVGLSGGALWSTPSILLHPSELRLHGIIVMKEQKVKSRKLAKKRKDSSAITFSTHINKVLELIDSSN